MVINYNEARFKGPQAVNLLVFSYVRINNYLKN